MLQSIIASKVSQSQEFTPEGARIPVTTVVAGPCYITKIDDNEKFKNVQVGFGIMKHISQAENGHIKKTGLDKKLRFLRSFRVKEISADMKLGQELNLAEIFQVGDKIRVTGTGSGKGFASAIKRHNFKGGPRTHGQSDRERSPGSIGQTTTPGRVYKGKRMAGRMGGDRVTVRGLSVVSVDPENKILKIKGLIPGKTNGMIIISKEV
jgi:large subunit ribosomal protein L3